MRIRTKKVEHEIKVEWQGEQWPFTVLPLNVEEEDVLRKKYTTVEMIQGQLIPDPDFLGLKVEKVQKVIKAWPCEDEDGNPWECNDLNKKTAFILNPDLFNLVMTEASKIASGLAEIKAAEKKT